MPDPLPHDWQEPLIACWVETATHWQARGLRQGAMDQQREALQTHSQVGQAIQGPLEQLFRQLALEPLAQKELLALRRA